MGLEEFIPIFGEVRPEWAKNSSSGSGSFPLRRFLMHVFAPDYYHLKFQVTDFHSNTFEAVKSVMQLEDMRDSVGIGDSWSEFVDYFIASIKSEDVKLLLQSDVTPGGVAFAKLVAQKSKGMPLISISLIKLVGPDSGDAMENVSFGLFNAFKCAQTSATQEHSQAFQLTKVIPSEQGTSKIIQSQLDERQKLERTSCSYKEDASALPAGNGSQASPDKQADRASTKVTNRVVPAYRRAKVRGASLRNTEDDEDK